MFDSLFAKGRLSLERLRSLVEVAQAGGIANAAPGNLTRQGQYSRQLGELEDFFGTKLATRHRRRLELNAEGRRLAEIGQEILLKLQDFRANRLSAPIEVTVGAYESLIHWRLAGKIGAFQDGSNKIACRLKAQPTSEIISGLLDLKSDFGVVRQSAVKPPLKGQFLFRMDYAVFAPRDLVPAARVKDPVWILQNVPLALHESANEFKQALTHGMNTTELRVHLQCETAVQASRAVLSGNCCSILPAIATEEFDEKTYVRLEAAMLKDYVRKICLAWNPRLFDLREGFRQLKDRLASCLMEATIGQRRN